MATQYKDVYGRTYSPSQVEKVGGAYYVAGTSINVSPVSSGGSTSTTTSTAGRTSGGGGGGSSTGGGSSSISPSSVVGYDPNWFRNLPPEVQQIAQAERQRVGAAPLPTDRPLTWEESLGGILPYESLPSGVQSVVRQAEEQAFAPWTYQQQLAKQLAEMGRRQQQLMESIWNRLTPQMPEIPAPTPPPRVEAPPAVEVPPAPESTPAPEQLPEGVSRGAGGFERRGLGLAAVPSVEDLLRTYEEVFGPQEGAQEEYVRQYLASPQFQRILQGAVPMWVEADPLWRQYLRRLGLLRSAVEQRLFPQE